MKKNGGKKSRGTIPLTHAFNWEGPQPPPSMCRTTGRKYWWGEVTAGWGGGGWGGGMTGLSTGLTYINITISPIVTLHIRQRIKII